MLGLDKITDTAEKRGDSVEFKVALNGIQECRQSKRLQTSLKCTLITGMSFHQREKNLFCVSTQPSQTLR